MSRQRQDQLLAVLRREDSWATAASLADQLGVTPRSIRSYVAALNARTAGAVDSGPAGYRAGAGAAAAAGTPDAQGTPRARLHRLIRTLVDEADGIDVYDTALALHVSETTLENDLGRVRALLDGGRVALERDRDRVRLRGDEQALRRLLSRLAQDEMDAGPLRPEALQRALAPEAVPAAAIGPFKSALVRELGDLGYYVNELAISDVLLHITIAAERVAAGRALAERTDSASAAVRVVGSAIARLADQHFGVALGDGDREHLANLVLTRVVAPGEQPPADAARIVDAEVVQAVRAEIEQAARDYQVDLVDEAFIVRLALHVQNLLHRAQESAWTRNPLTQSLKSSYPMIFDVAVSIASGLHDRLGVPLQEDEIAYIAMHVGGRLERSRAADTILTATIVCPGYRELQELLHSSVDRSLGRLIEVVRVDTSMDPDWSAIDTDLVLSTIPAAGTDERVVRITPFLAETDIERVQQAAARIRRARRLSRLREELQRYFSADAFLSPVPDAGEETIIRMLGGMLTAGGLIGDDYISGTIERERMSSTAFTDALAVPHALQMTARRTAIAIGIADGSVAWGAGRVQVVALAAFSEDDRDAFQTVFEQLVEVFSERESVQRIVRRATGFDAFLDELVAVIDG
ncbi:BglG family transcription antiterminator [Microbacterium arabinogalactanolyticum]|uniref:BglG family transcription antiterminator n=1 Tax=Microbacterium arabinogalactanolyticum TaxID=69365 RepID=UPI0025537AA7|nr:PRD domain-containing protein [Microbacterium arabinogalactanolyticum]GLC85766.1 transcriptional antiterminator [Microbacterium arabinogalactanolyticum]